MKNTTLHKIIPPIILMFAFIFPLTSNANSTNILHRDYFGFEAGASAWYFWGTNDYWNVVTEKASEGNYSMKFSFDDLSEVSSTVKAQTGGSSNAGAQIVLKAGTHKMYVDIWIEPGTTIKNFGLVIKDPWKVYSWQIDTVTPGKWVTISRDITVASDTQSDWQIVVEGSETGGGTFYLDNFAIYQDIVIPKVVQDLSQINMKDSIAFNLPADQYQMTLKVFKGSGTTLREFYTHLEKNGKALKWDISTQTEESWIELEQNFTTLTDVDEEQIRITIPNDPNRGGGTGLIFVDDLNIEKTSFTPENNKPRAIAGYDILLESSGKITLSGSSSFDIDGDSLRFQWASPSGIILNNAKAIDPEFTVEQTSIQQDYDFILKVNDGLSDSESDTVHVTVKANANAINKTTGNSGIRIHPNPTSDFLVIEGLSCRSVKVCDLSGKHIFSQIIDKYNPEIDMRKLEQGMYIISTREGSFRVIKK